MWFLLKAGFWLGLVILLLPMPESEDGSTAHVSARETIAVFGSAFNDMKGFCARNPDSCATGAVAMQNFGYKAQYGAKLLHEFISEKLDESKDLVPPKGSRPLAHQKQNGVDTLRADDREPNWRGPREQVNRS